MNLRHAPTRSSQRQAAVPSWALMLVQRIVEPILVTGATGFIGRRLVKRLVSEGYRPRAFVMPECAIDDDWAGQVDVVRGDVTDRASVGEAMTSTATLFHLAALTSDWELEARHTAVTVVGTENVLGEAARRGVRSLLSSSCIVYGHHLAKRVCDEGVPFGRCRSAYGRSKQRQEEISHRFEAEQGLRTTILRPSNVYGAGSEPWVDLMIERLKAEAPVLVDGGQGAAVLTHVDNVVEMFVRAAERPASIGRIYNASDETGVTWAHYLSELATLCGAPPPRSFGKLRAKMTALALDRRHRLAKNGQRPSLTRQALQMMNVQQRIPAARARNELGYDPPISYNQGMEDVARYLGAQARSGVQG